MSFFSFFIYFDFIYLIDFKQLKQFGKEYKIY